MSIRSEIPICFQVGILFLGLQRIRRLRQPFAWEVDQKKIGSFFKELRNEKLLTQEQVADYSNEEKLRLTKRMHILFIIGLITFILYVVTTLVEPLQDSHVYDLWKADLVSSTWIRVYEYENPSVEMTGRVLLMSHNSTFSPQSIVSMPPLSPARLWSWKEPACVPCQTGLPRVAKYTVRTFHNQTAHL